MAKKKSQTAAPPPDVGGAKVVNQSRSRGCLKWAMGLLLLACGVSYLVSPRETRQPTPTPPAVAENATVEGQAQALLMPTLAAASETPAPTVTASATITETATSPAVQVVAIIVAPTSTSLPAATIAPGAADEAVTKTPNTTYYAQSGGANIRTCPRTDAACTVVTQLAAGMPIVSNGRVIGDEANAGNAIWYRVQYQGEDAYVYSGVMGTQAPASASSATSNTGSGAASGGGGSATGGQSASPMPMSVSGAAAECSTFDYSVCSNYQTPRNCDEAVAMGIPARDTACCFPARDGNKNGVACYGS